jgi:succinate-semialdehyde dehydrogenase/glutarate-semialdehyde dehydrogenase
MPARTDWVAQSSAATAGEAIARRMRVGMTSVNDALIVFQIAALPFGGRADSGYARKHGDDGLREFAYPHAITDKTGPAKPPTTTLTGRPARWLRLLPLPAITS